MSFLSTDMNGPLSDRGHEQRDHARESDASHKDRHEGAEDGKRIDCGCHHRCDLPTIEPINQSKIATATAEATTVPIVRAAASRMKHALMRASAVVRSAAELRLQTDRGVVRLPSSPVGTVRLGDRKPARGSAPPKPRPPAGENLQRGMTCFDAAGIALIVGMTRRLSC